MWLVQGFFADSLPTAAVGRIALLRMDGDLFSRCRGGRAIARRSRPANRATLTSCIVPPDPSPARSTSDILYNLYERVSLGGFVIVDDYGIEVLVIYIYIYITIEYIISHTAPHACGRARAHTRNTQF